jgi:low affinity Fe/Cu permease
MHDSTPRPFTPIARLGKWATEKSGSNFAFGFAVLYVCAWFFVGPLFGYSDTWQLVINTSTSIVTFLMVFLIQRAQNKDTLALQLKLNEIVAALDGASNRLINVEQFSEAEVRALHERYEQLAAKARDRRDPGEARSVEETDEPADGK